MLCNVYVKMFMYIFVHTVYLFLFLSSQGHSMVWAQLPQSECFRFITKFLLRQV